MADTTTLTIDLDSIAVILTADEIDQLGSDACRRVAQAMQAVADRNGFSVSVAHERVSGKRRDEDATAWERLAITLADEVVSELGI